MTTRACAAVVLVCGSAASAQSWSLAAMADANPTANPNGPWMYRWNNGAADLLLGGPTAGADGVQGEYLWSNGQPTPMTALLDVDATGGTISFQTIQFGPGQVRMDPQSAASVSVHFTAPVAGLYRLTGSFDTCDTSPHTKHIRMIANNGQFAMPIINRDLTTGGQTFDIENVNLQTGQTVDWLVWSLGDPSNLSTCVSVTATLGGGAACYANCDASTTAPVLNVGDFTCFLQKFAAGDPYANCDQSAAAPVLNVADFTCFLQKYAAGCP
jgi:hypothetical protein